MIVSRVEYVTVPRRQALRALVWVHLAGVGLGLFLGWWWW